MLMRRRIGKLDGLRRPLDASPSHISVQFLIDAAYLALMGGSACLALGIGVASATALISGQPLVIPAETAAASTDFTVIAGALAGLYSALRASSPLPKLALRST